MENSCGIIGLRDDEIELELGLSIGGSFGKAQKLKPIKKDSNTKSNLVADLGESVVFDLQTRREIQALRRQEAKKKREEKHQKRGTVISSRGHQNGELGSRDHEVDAPEERECKKNKVEGISGNVNLNLSAEQNNPLVCPVIPLRVPCPYPQVQFVPLANGFAYSCVNATPCWVGGAGNEKVVVQPVMGNGRFRPFQAGQESGANGYDSEQKSSRDERNRKTRSGSPMCSSSVVSDLQSSSNQGGCSSETGTNTSHCQLASVASNVKGQSEQSATSHQLDSAQSIDKPTQGIEKAVSLKTTESPLSTPKENPKPEIQATPKSNPILSKEILTTPLTKDSKGDLGKPPKPKIPSHNDILALRSMPCVSTRSNGPNGKTVNGFLYRYTKSEVSIICVCHGSSFTPAEFVQHAGGSDVSHPLRHITVIPSAF